ncbi:helix-turn-helix transcriptional regulator [Rugosimonospora acidiphila]|uniref:Helix-turn-helix transcriptional regulator n=1 Tax=Rugosimonospora acidiphila TaxID=556531 RepID=A0ABP9RQC1_9ACTN
MATGDLPAVARRRVWMALRRAREAKGLTQGQIADEMEWSLSKVMRIEKGEVNISVSDLRAVLDYLDVTDPAEVKQLLDDARAARSERRSANSAFRQHLTTTTQQLLQYEAEAVTIRFYSLVLIPGLLQTEAYAKAVFEDIFEDLSPEAIDARIDIRMRRRENVLDRPEPPDYLFLLDESVLSREIGGPRVMGEQLMALLRFMHEASVLVRVVPLDAKPTLALLGPFMILDLDSDGNSALYRESVNYEELSHRPALVARHREVFEQLWSLARSEVDSAKLIETAARRMLNEDVGSE